LNQKEKSHGDNFSVNVGSFHHSIFNRRIMEVVKIESHPTHFSVLVEDISNQIKAWLDIAIDKVYKDVDVEWNQYIFYLDNGNDVAKREWQDDVDNFDQASSIAIYELESKGLIYQDVKGRWFKK
jgi:hypothetical protein